MKRNLMAIFIICTLFSVNFVFSANVNVAKDLPDALFNAVSAANVGDVFILADGGVYPNTVTIPVSKAITIKTADGAVNKANLVLSSGASGYPSNMFAVNASLTVKNIKCNGKRGTNPTGGQCFNRGNLTGAKLELDGVEVTRFNFISGGAIVDSLVVTNCFFNGNLTAAGNWGSTFSMGQGVKKYAKLQNNTFIYCNFGPFQGQGWGNKNSVECPQVIVDHNTVYNIEGPHGCPNMISRTNKVQFTNNLFANGTFRPQESFSNKWIDYPQNTELDSVAKGKWGPGLSPYWGVITKLGPSGVWMVSLEYVDSAKTVLDMQANNIYWTKEVTDMWKAKGLKKPPMWSYETSKAMKDSTKACFEEEVTFVNAPATYMTAVTMVADSCVKMQGNKSYKSAPSPFSGWTYYDKDGNAQYDLRTRANINMSYNTSSKSYTAGTDGKPLGDLNWWPTSVKENNPMVSKFTLEQNYPNPFNPTTQISYILTKSGKVNLTIYDMLGKAVKTLVNESQAAGRYSYHVDASDLSSGIYFYTLTTASEIVTKKMALVR